MQPHLLYQVEGREPLIIPITDEIVAADVSFEAFLEREDWVETGHVEWVNGYVVKMATIEFAHDQLVACLRMLFKALLELTGGGVVTGDPMVMYLPDAQSGRAPDVIVLLPDHQNRLKRNRTEGAADLVVEVVSPGSRRTDRITKVLEYEKDGVREYWILDPLKRLAEFYVLGTDGAFVAVDADDDGVYRSRALPQMALLVEVLWREPLPGFYEIAQMARAMAGSPE